MPLRPRPRLLSKVKRIRLPLIRPRSPPMPPRIMLKRLPTRRRRRRTAPRPRRTRRILPTRRRPTRRKRRRLKRRRIRRREIRTLKTVTRKPKRSARRLKMLLTPTEIRRIRTRLPRVVTKPRPNKPRKQRRNKLRKSRMTRLRRLMIRQTPKQRRSANLNLLKL